MLSQVPDDELAEHAGLANDEIDQAIASGAAYTTPTGDLYTRDANVNFAPHLAIIHENDAREAPPPTSDEPTIGTPDLRGSIEGQIEGAKSMVDQLAFRRAFGVE